MSVLITLLVGCTASGGLAPGGHSARQADRGGSTVLGHPPQPFVNHIRAALHRTFWTRVRELEAVTAFVPVAASRFIRTMEQATCR